MQLHYLNYLETYIEVVKTGSFYKAARNLYLSQPAVSFQIQKLEQEVGCRLIDREKRNFAVTREGKRFFRFAEYVYLEHRHLFHDLSQMIHGITGTLEITSSPVAGEFLLPSVLNEFKEFHQSIEVRMSISADSFAVIDEVVKGRNLIGFTGVKPETSELEAFSIVKDEIVLIVYPSHPFAGQKEVTVGDLMGESLIFRQDVSKLNKTFGVALNRAGLDLEQCQTKLILGTTTGMISAVVSKAGIGLISSIVLRHIDVLGSVKVVKVKNLKITRDIYCIYRKEDINNSLIKDFIDFIKRHFEVKE